MHTSGAALVIGIRTIKLNANSLTCRGPGIAPTVSAALSCQLRHGQGKMLEISLLGHWVRTPFWLVVGHRHPDRHDGRLFRRMQATELGETERRQTPHGIAHWRAVTVYFPLVQILPTCGPAVSCSGDQEDTRGWVER